MSTDFSAKWLDSQKSLLLKMKSELMNQIKTYGNEDLVRPKDQYAEDGDMAQANQDQALSFELRDKDLQKIREIDAALERIENGSYGYCEETDEPIAKIRLEKIPWARYTVAAQEELERNTGFKRIA